MGNLIKAVCECGFESEQLMQGAGFSYGEEVYYEPAYCDQCGLVDIVNVNDANHECKHCTGEMKVYKEEHVPLDPTDLDIPLTDYLQEKDDWHCPECKENKLSFITIGLWD